MTKKTLETCIKTFNKALFLRKNLKDSTVLLKTKKELLKAEGFSKTYRHELFTSDMLNNIKTRANIISYIDEFNTIETYSADMQVAILNFLSYLAEAKEIIVDAYKKRLHFAYIEDINPLTMSSALLRVKSSIGLEILRNEYSIVNDEGFIENLIEFGDKSDGKLIADSLMRCTKKEYVKKMIVDCDDHWLFVKLKEMEFFSNPLLLEGLVDFFLTTNLENITTLQEKLMVQFGCNKECIELKNSLYSLNEADEISVDLRKNLKEYWSNHSKEDRRKKLYNTTRLYDLSFLSLYRLAETMGTTNSSSLQFSRLLISTGKRLAFRENGYFFNFQEDIKKWLDYLEKNKEKFEAGRWIRYGEYVD